MKTHAAVQEVINKHKLTKYRLAMMIGATPPSVDQWLRGTRMSPAYKVKFNELFGVKINDDPVYISSSSSK